MPAQDLILALDPATRTGVAYGAADAIPRLWTENFGREDSKPEDIYERSAFFFADFLRQNPVDLFVIEGVVSPFGARGFTNHNTTMITVGLYGIFVGLARCKRIPWRAVQIRKWRKAILGRGDLKTDEAKRAAFKICRQLGWDPTDHNSAEAGCIFSWARGQLNSNLFEATRW